MVAMCYNVLYIYFQKGIILGATISERVLKNQVQDLWGCEFASLFHEYM